MQSLGILQGEEDMLLSQVLSCYDLNFIFVKNSAPHKKKSL